LRVNRRAGDTSVHIVLPGEDMKGDKPIEMPLPESTVRLLAAYLKTYRPQLCGELESALFPGPNGARSRGGLRRAITRFIYRETELKMNPHLFRHLAAKLHLELHPEAIETMRRLLGHVSTRTTLSAYADLSTALAFRRYDETIAHHREGRQTPAARPRNKISTRGQR
ncbi:MAG: tyrosine-type recombinase/integrase, partial [Caulobacteraceae bacterium]